MYSQLLVSNILVERNEFNLMEETHKSEILKQVGLAKQQVEVSGPSIYKCVHTITVFRGGWKTAC